MDYPKKKIFCFIGIMGLLLVSFSTLAADKQVFTVKMRPPIQYESNDGKKFTAQYGSLSDGTLNFVKLKMPDGRQYTLPQVMSGSGVRYTDEREIVWWEHQGTVRVDVRGAGGEWKTQYSGLKEIQKRN